MSYSGHWHCGEVAVVERLKFDCIDGPSAETRKSGHCREAAVCGGLTGLTVLRLVPQKC